MLFPVKAGARPLVVGEPEFPPLPARDGAAAAFAGRRPARAWKPSCKAQVAKPLGKGPRGHTRDHTICVQLGAGESELAYDASSAKTRASILRSWQEFALEKQLVVTVNSVTPKVFWDFGRWLGTARQVTSSLPNYLSVVGQMLSWNGLWRAAPFVESALIDCRRRLKFLNASDSPRKAWVYTLSAISSLPSDFDRRMCMMMIDSGLRGASWDGIENRFWKRRSPGLVQLITPRVKHNPQEGSFIATTGAEWVFQGDVERPLSEEYRSWIYQNTGTTGHSARRTLAVYVRVQCAKRGWHEISQIPKKTMERIQEKFGWSIKSAEFLDYSHDYRNFASTTVRWPIGFATHYQIFGDMQGYTYWDWERR